MVVQFLSQEIRIDSYGELQKSLLGRLVLALPVFLQRKDDGLPAFVMTDSVLSPKQVKKTSFCQSVMCSDQLIHLVYPAIIWVSYYSQFVLLVQ